MKVYINTDAAVGPPNPGPAGAGYVIVFRRDAEWDAAVGSVPLSPRTHHEAEYEAAILAPNPCRAARCDLRGSPYRLPAPRQSAEGQG